MNLLIVDITSKFGAFNKVSTNVGGLLTYRIPPKTTVVGMLGAILGLSFEKSIDIFEGLKYSVKPLNKSKSLNFTFNCHYGGRKGRMVNVQQEILVDPQYRLYLEIPELEIATDWLNRFNFDYRGPNTLFDFLTGIMERNISYYSLFMGKNQFPLKYELRADFRKNWSKINPKNFNFDSEYQVYTAIPKKSVKNYSVELASEAENAGFFDKMTPETREYFRIFNIKNLPLKQDVNRRFIKFEDFYLKETNTTVSLKIKLKREISNYSIYLNDNEIIVCH